MGYLEYFLLTRTGHLWEQRNLPSYLGPSVYQFTHFLSLVSINSVVLFAVSILFVRSLWSLVTNTYTIEGWEIERHEALVRRARKLGGYVEGPGGVRVQITKQEFPYDIGVWENLKQGMGSGNILSWFSPFSSTPTPESGLSYEINGFEDPSLTWPPPDPDKMRHAHPPPQQQHEDNPYSSAATQLDILAFRRRQWEDLNRQRALGNRHFQQQPQRQLANESDENRFGEREEGEEEESVPITSSVECGEWTNSDGDRLKDFGVDDDDDEEEEENIPLAELIQRRRNTIVPQPLPDPDPERTKKQV
ncbi:MAG: Palmitoyltransferase [Geoglossum umbratile]|nr:MAG: Palmitoyltransferase [Geoglossum umbratile]